jgi:hypothetical protein
MKYEKEDKSMRQFALVLFTLLSLFNEANLYTGGNIIKVQNDNLTQESIQQTIPNHSKELTAMEALDLVKEHYAVNFEKVAKEDTKEYFYKLLETDYYLVYEGYYPKGSYYLIHLYEFAIDFPETNIGHMVTYGWFIVDKKTGEVTVQI